MHLNPLDVEAAPTSRIREWLYFWDEQTMYESYKSQESAWRASEGTVN